MARNGSNMQDLIPDIFFVRAITANRRPNAVLWLLASGAVSRLFNIDQAALAPARYSQCLNSGMVL